MRDPGIHESVRIIHDSQEAAQARERARQEFRDRVAVLMLQGRGWTVQRGSYARWWPRPEKRHEA